MGRKTIAFIFVFFLISSISAHRVFADFDCTLLNSSSTAAEKAYCQTELDQLNQQLTELNSQLADQQKQTGTLKGDVTALTTQIAALKVKIKARTLAIAQLKVSIDEKSSTIQSLSDQIDSEQESLAQLLRNTNELDNSNILDLILSDQDLSNFYSDLESYASIQQSVKTSVDEINGVKTQTQSEESDLQQQQDAEVDAQAELEASQQQVAQSEASQQQLLAISKQKESSYSLLMAQKKAQAAKIRSALFSLAGLSQKIDFGTALSYAQAAQATFGIDPAFLLAILTQESNLGANVGQCNIPNTRSWDEIMPGPIAYQNYVADGYSCDANAASPCSSRDDQTPFQAIVASLGLSPNGVALSCPIPSDGPWGGAMGPAQFIPSTWELFADRLKAAIGYEANPWSPRDAFMASAMYLTDLGAIGPSQSAQNKAACRYYGSGGSSCTYSRNVEKLKEGIQANINLLSS